LRVAKLADEVCGTHELAFLTAISIRFLHRRKTRELNRAGYPCGIEEIAAADPVHDKEFRPVHVMLQ
jgi:hypothetical protein